MSDISSSRLGAPNDFLFLHEVGHRWLYYFDFLEDGTVKTLYGHPSQSMDTSAAFPLSATVPTRSPMGGNSWTDKGDGRFARTYCGFRTGFSWHELYLMGLAAPEEVAPWFHFEPSQYVGFGGPCETLYSGQRRNIEIGAVRAATGDQSPSAAASQKEFRVVLVLLTKHAFPSEETMEKISELRRAAASSLFAATGGRARLTMLPAIPGRRRSVRR